MAIMSCVTWNVWHDGYVCGANYLIPQSAIYLITWKVLLMLAGLRKCKYIMGINMLKNLPLLVLIDFESCLNWKSNVKWFQIRLDSWYIKAADNGVSQRFNEPHASAGELCEVCWNSTFRPATSGQCSPGNFSGAIWQYFTKYFTSKTAYTFQTKYFKVNKVCISVAHPYI